MTLRDVGLKLATAVPWIEDFARHIYRALPTALHDTPTSRVRTFFSGQPSVTFVQIGAYDGVAGDPLRGLIVGHETWRGILVEPQPEAFARLCANYAAEGERVELVNAAISDVSGELDFFVIPSREREQSGLPDWSEEIASFDADHLRRCMPGVELQKVTVTTRTFDEVAGMLPDSRVDLVVMDVEGHEARLLHAIDFDRHGVRFLIFEHKHMSPYDTRAVLERLQSFGFSLKAFGRDTIAWRVGA